MQFSVRTDKGNVRDENQDGYANGIAPGGAVWALVCDGMGGAGGHQGGSVASKLACEIVARHIAENIDEAALAQDVQDVAHRAIVQANKAIFREAAANPALQGMGTTIVLTVIKSNVLTVAHVGDSRVYLVRDGTFYQLTRDHSMVQELLEKGTITEEEALNHPRKNLITRALGIEKSVDIEYKQFNAKKDDIVLLCSDGLSGCVADEYVFEIIRKTDFDKTAEALVDAALVAGGKDNITALLVGPNKSSGGLNG